MVEIFDDLKDLQKAKLKGDVIEQVEDKVEKKVNFERDFRDLQEKVWKLERKVEELCSDDDEDKDEIKMGILDY